MKLAFTLAKNATKPNPFEIIPLQNKEGEQLEDRRSVGASSCNSGDGTDQRVQSLMFMMIIIIQGCFPLLGYCDLVKNDFESVQNEPV